ncbi:Phage DNA primase [Salmonella enterica subsp. enterica serovar Typhimurium]|nr:Phage DNA primase [Salmonella enterica subsp. enterica serovar Typhimurium]
MKVAASVCGGTDYWHSWRATGNALEGIASRHNDALLPLDELREVDPREAGMIAYMLANGQGKGRARTDGEVRNRRHWTLLLFFHRGAVAGGTHRTRRGAYLRRDGRAHGTNPQPTPGSMARLSNYTALPAASSSPIPLCDRVARFHGTGLSCLAGLPHPRPRRQHHASERVTSPLPERPDAGQRWKPGAAHRGPFCPAGGGGEIATLHGITGWQKGTAYEAVQICLHAWAERARPYANQEDEGVLAQIKRFITAHQYSRFASWDGPDRPLNMAGFRRVGKRSADGRGTHCSSSCRRAGGEICRGFSPARAARLCQEAECLQPGSDGKYQVAGSPAGDRQNQGLPAYLPHPQYLSAV